MSDVAIKDKKSSQFLTRLMLGLVVIVLIVGAISRFSSGPLNAQFQTFVTIFMGIFVEAVPFLLAGSIVSGLIAVFVNPETLARVIPRQPILAALTGSLLGFTFPVCECGVVPVTRRLYQKGLPLSVGIAFLLAAPVVNPIVVLSTYAAFGWGPVLIGRFVFTILIAFIIGLIFTLADTDEVLRPGMSLTNVFSIEPEVVYAHDGTDIAAMEDGHAHSAPSRRERFWQAMTVGADDFFDMARYLIIGSMMAATMQTLVPQSTLLAFGSGPIISVVLLMILAFVLSVCSTVDAFLALSFVNSFTTGSILGFLVFGPMVDVKSSLMFLGVFRRRIVGYLILLPLLLSLVVSVFVNLYLG
ncbi:MAG: permease [Chloroflexota bacterium]